MGKFLSLFTIKMNVFSSEFFGAQIKIGSYNDQDNSEKNVFWSNWVSIVSNISRQLFCVVSGIPHEISFQVKRKTFLGIATIKI